MCQHNLVDATDLRPPETTATLQSYRGDPELGNFVLALNMNVLRLALIAGVEKQPVRSMPKYRGHKVLRAAFR
jgi:hypothetical protein